VAVIDPKRPEPVEQVALDGRTSALMISSVHILKATGAWDDFTPYIAPLETLRMIDGDKRSDFHAAELGLPFFGMNMPNNVGRTLLMARAEKEKNIHIACPDTVTSINRDDFGVTITLQSGVMLRAPLLAGADGRHSFVREQINIAAKTVDFKQSAITVQIDHTRSHDNISTEFHRNGGPFTIVPLPGNRSSIVWVEYTNDAQNFMHLRRQDFEQALQDRTEQLVGRVTLAGTPSCWPLVSMRAERLIAPRVALVAEAAHVLHPLGAQGLNLSLRDAATLAEEIVDAARAGLDIGSQTILRRYESRRRADILTRLVGTGTLNRMVSNEIGLLKTLRHAGMEAISTLPPLRKFAMQEGIQPGYDDSRLARGQPL
jgi:2-octaprenyl-6-methoxyphenol hydroxylase